MLTFQQIKDFYSDNCFVVNPRASLVEYLQYEVLDSLYKQKNSDKLVFIGGMAIRIVYKGQRFSEDLDFDNFGLNFKEFEKMLNLVADDLRLKGFEIESRSVDYLAFHFYIKFPELLFKNRLSSNRREKILIRIDTLKKEEIFKPQPVILNNFNIYRKILVCPPAIILAQKFLALLERKRTKGRNLYDISYLFGIAKPDYNYLSKITGLGVDDIKKKILAQVKELNIKQLSQEVKPFLCRPEELDRVVSFKDYIKQVL
ncbi:MAG TPA: hypothetical protein ENN31_01710 [Candidatus Vogelbacteria bacterium]|nr:hypothetical protein [Candidatus Vogelbacteria bacterium]